MPPVRSPSGSSNPLTSSPCQQWIEMAMVASFFKATSVSTPSSAYRCFAKSYALSILDIVHVSELVNEMGDLPPRVNKILSHLLPGAYSPPKTKKDWQRRHKRAQKDRQRISKEDIKGQADIKGQEKNLKKTGNVGRVNPRKGTKYCSKPRHTNTFVDANLQVP